MLNLQRENSILSKAPPPMSSRSKSLSDDGFSKPPYMSSSPQPSPPDSRQNRSSSIALQSVSDQSESGLSQHQLQNSLKSSFTNSKEQTLFSKDTCDSLPEFTVQSSSNRKVKGSGKLKGSRRRVVPAKKWYIDWYQITQLDVEIPLSEHQISWKPFSFNRTTPAKTLW